MRWNSSINRFASLFIALWEWSIRVCAPSCELCLTIVLSLTILNCMFLLRTTTASIISTALSITCMVARLVYFRSYLLLEIAIARYCTCSCSTTRLSIRIVRINNEAFFYIRFIFFLSVQVSFLFWSSYYFSSYKINMHWPFIKKTII